MQILTNNFFYGVVKMSYIIDKLLLLFKMFAGSGSTEVSD